MTYKIYSAHNGTEYGTYEASNETKALIEMFKDAGYSVEESEALATPEADNWEVVEVNG